MYSTALPFSADPWHTAAMVAKRTTAKRRNPSHTFRAGHDPNTVYLLARNRKGQPTEVFSYDHDGTVEGVREAAKMVRMYANSEVHEWSSAKSTMAATDERGRNGWSISPDLAQITRAPKPAVKAGKSAQRNPSPRKYRTRQYDVLEWSARAQSWSPVGRVAATTPKYAIEEFMASVPGYSKPHLRAEEIAPSKSAAKHRNPALSASEARENLRAELDSWGAAREDMPVGLWSSIAKDAKVSASEMRAVADVASVAEYNARHGQPRPVSARMRREIADALVETVDRASDAKVLAYVRARSRFINK